MQEKEKGRTKSVEGGEKKRGFREHDWWFLQIKITEKLQNLHEPAIKFILSGTLKIKYEECMAHTFLGAIHWGMYGSKTPNFSSLVI